MTSVKQLIVGELATNCYLLVSENEMAVIDPGGEAEKILKEKNIGVNLKYIINTHEHPDHTSANEEIQKESGAKILIHEAEKDFVNFKTVQFLKDEDEIKLGKSILKVIHTPGHTKGSICLLGEKFIFSGDTLFKEGYGRTDLPGGSEKEIRKSLEKLAKLLKPGFTIYPGHGESFKL